MLIIVNGASVYTEIIGLGQRALPAGVDFEIEFITDAHHPRRPDWAVRHLDLTSDPPNMLVDLRRIPFAARQIFPDCHRTTSYHLVLAIVVLGGIADLVLLNELVQLPTLAARRHRRTSWATDRLMEEVRRDNRFGAPLFLTGSLGTRLTRELQLTTRLIEPAGPRSGGDPRFGRASELLRSFRSEGQFSTGDVVSILGLREAGFTDPEGTVRRAGRDAGLGVEVVDHRGVHVRMYRAGEIDPLRDVVLTGGYLRFTCRHRRDRRVCPDCSRASGLIVPSGGPLVMPDLPYLRSWLLDGVHRLIRQFGA